MDNKPKRKLNILLDLFLTFAKIGLFTFGGGLAMVSLVESICVEDKKWFSHDEFMNMVVIAESTPGPIAINAATSIGYKQAKLKGAIIATLGVVLPSFIIITLIAMVFDDFLSIRIVSYAFKGICIAVGILILRAGINMLAKMKKKPVNFIVMVTVLVVMLLIDYFAWNFSSVYLIIISAVVSLIVFAVFGKGGEKA